MWYIVKGYLKSAVGHTKLTLRIQVFWVAMLGCKFNEKEGTVFLRHGGKTIIQGKVSCPRRLSHQ
jgi:hypothetical protein